MDLQWTQSEVDELLDQEFDGDMEVFDIVRDQLATDYLVDDSFREAVGHDDEITDHEADVYLDLCDIVENIEKGYILND